MPWTRWLYGPPPVRLNNVGAALLGQFTKETLKRSVFATTNQKNLATWNLLETMFCLPIHSKKQPPVPCLKRIKESVQINHTSLVNCAKRRMQNHRPGHWLPCLFPCLPWCIQIYGNVWRLTSVKCETESFLSGKECLGIWASRKEEMFFFFFFFFHRATNKISRNGQSFGKFPCISFLAAPLQWAKRLLCHIAAIVSCRRRHRQPP